MAGRGPDRRYPDMVLEPLGSNSGQEPWWIVTSYNELW